MKKSVLVMGGSYFIGKKIVDTLLLNGYLVYTFNRGTRPCDARVKNLTGDRNDSESVKEALKDFQFDVVIDVSALNKMQVEILYNSLNRKNLKQFVFISSSAVYDVEHEKIPFKETDMLGENKYWTCYGTNKIEAEQFLIESFSNSNTHLAILRPPYIYGENNYAQRESFIFDHICSGRPIIIPNSGDTKLQFIYTGDLAYIIIKLLNTELPQTSIFNVGNKTPVTIKEWISFCSCAAGKAAKTISFDYEKYGKCVREFFPFYDYDNVLDVRKINQIYSYETDFLEGLKKAYAWYLQNKSNIAFKENVTKNEETILKLLQ